MNKKKLIHFSGLDNDIVLRIYAVILAIAIWFIMSITLFPTITVTIKNIPITIPTQNSTAASYNLEPISFKEQYANVKIKGKRYEIGNLKASDLKAEAVALTSINKSGEYTLQVKVTAKDGTDFEVLSIDPSSVNVKFDTIIEKEFIVEAQAPYVLTPAGYLIETPTAIPETITVKGPQQQVDRIDKVVIRADYSDELTASKSINDTKILLYDDDILLDNSIFTFSTDNFSINVPVFMTKDLPFTVQLQNTPPNFDTSILKFIYSNDTIKVAGSTWTLENMDEIPLGYIDIREIGLDSYFDFDVSLPDGFRNLSDINSVTVKLDTENLATKTISLTKNQIHVLNTPSEYDVNVINVGISNVTIVGPKQIIEHITAEDIIAEVDLTNQEVNEKTYSKPVKIYCPQNNQIWALDKINVGLEFKHK